MSIAIRKAVFLKSEEWARLSKIIAEFGFVGRGNVSAFLKKVAGKDSQIVFIEGKCKIKIENGE